MILSLHLNSPVSRTRRPRRVERWLVVLTIVLGVVPVATGQTLDVTTATIEDIGRAFEAGTLTSERLVEIYLERIAATMMRGRSSTPLSP